MNKKDVIIIILYWLILGLVLGWLLPFEGPFDSSIRQGDTDKKSKQVGVATSKKPVMKEILVDLNNDEIPEWYMLIPEEYE